MWTFYKSRYIHQLQGWSGYPLWPSIVVFAWNLWPCMMYMQQACIMCMADSPTMYDYRESMAHRWWPQKMIRTAVNALCLSRRASRQTLMLKCGWHTSGSSRTSYLRTFLSLWPFALLRTAWRSFPAITVRRWWLCAWHFQYAVEINKGKPARLAVSCLSQCC